MVIKSTDGRTCNSHFVVSLHSFQRLPESAPKGSETDLTGNSALALHTLPPEALSSKFSLILIISLI